MLALLLALALALCPLALAGCGSSYDEELEQAEQEADDEETSTDVSEVTEGDDEADDAADEDDADAEEPVDEDASADVTLADVPAYSGTAYVEINGNAPSFSDEELASESFEDYSELDELGRCGVAFALIGTETMPTEERGSIGMVKPSGWQLVKYDIVDGGYLYNRCHLIGYQLAGENANEKNLITGTRYLNVEGMLPFENDIADYVESTGNHVLYRVTPLFDGDNLVASGVLMEAQSVEDDGAGVCFCVYCYNVQPGVSIDYADGTSELDEDAEAEDDADEAAAEEDEEALDYVLNTNTMRFHYPSCSSVDDMAEHNKQSYHGLRSTLIERGYSPCGRCNP